MPSVATSAPAAVPVGTSERLNVLDVMRGVAIYGILLSNVDAFAGYGFLAEAQRAALPGARHAARRRDRVRRAADGVEPAVAGAGAFGPVEWLWRMFTYRRRLPLFR